MAIPKRPKRQRKGDRLTAPDARREEIQIDYAVAPFDRLAIEMDRKWGVDRLPTLAYATTAEKYGGLIGDLNEAIGETNAAKVSELVPRLMQGMRVMDAEAEAAGFEEAASEGFEFKNDDLHFVIATDANQWPAFERTHPGVRVVSLNEIAQAIAYRDKIVISEQEVRAHFPDAYVSDVRPKRSAVPEDQIPFP